MAYIANHLQSQENQEKLQKAFREFDKNGDGVLEKEELVEGYIRMGMKRVDAVSAVEDVMKKIDINNNGTIDFSEFLMANLTKEETLSNDKLREAFKIFDKDGNGQITIDEFKEVLGDDDSESLWVVLNEADKNGDGQISFPEFKSMVISMFKQ